MQYLRGFSLEDKKNFGHTYITEISNRLRMHISGTAVTVLSLVSFAIVIMQLAFF